MKNRIDVLLTEKGLSQTREKAKRVIMAGLVFVDGQRCDKAGTMVDEDARIEVRGDDCPYVSRGGLKLERALDSFGLDVNGLVCIDIGSSTGGFTDCLLQRGAAKVYAVDSGTNQLVWKLRSDDRVVCMEKYNFRYAAPSDFADRMGFACTDVSFISLKHILPPAASLLEKGARMVCLIKPQFEAGREQVGKNGIVKDPKVHAQVIENVLGYAAESGFSALSLDHSPVKGTKGNIEYLLLLERSDEPANAVSAEAVRAIVEKAHGELD
ncbi:MAG: TlyA family RNA methyltransferase [Clostridia bacterium]|nr:TlyA family RNA methyltransferase [Clostridia bacterium]